MSETKQRQSKPWVYQGERVGIIPGVPARDLTEDEYAAWVKAGKIVAGEPSGKIYKKAAAKAADTKGAN